MSGIIDSSSPDGQKSRKGIAPLPLIGVALFLILVWGSAFTMVGVAVRTISPEWLVAYRMSFGAVLVLVYCLIRGFQFPSFSDGRWLWYLTLGLTGASLPFVLIATGQQTVDSGLTAIIVGSMPLITVILAHFFTDEKLNLWKAVGFVMGFAGVVILFLPEELSLTLVADWQAQLLILGGAFSYAATTIIADRAPETNSAIGAAMMLMAGAVMSSAWAFGVEGVPVMPNLTALLCIIGLGIGSTGIATVTYLWFIDAAGPSAMAKVNYFVPVCSVILGVWFLSEPLDWRIYVSLSVIILGVIISRKGN